MQIILKEEIHNLGNPGDVVKVRDGYARNFLLPRKMAVMADSKNIRTLEHERRNIASKLAKIKTAALGIASGLKELTLEFTRDAGEEGKLFGAVTTSDIADALKAKGIDIDRRKLRAHEAIKHIGEFFVEARLHPEVIIPFTVKVSAKSAE